MHQLTQDKCHLQEAKGKHDHDTSLLNHGQLQFANLPHRKDQDSDINGSVNQRRAKEELLILNGAVTACLGIPERIDGNAVKDTHKDLPPISLEVLIDRDARTRKMIQMMAHPKRI